MSSFRFSIRWLMGVVLFAAIAAAGVAQPTGPVAGLILMITHGVLGLAVVGAVCRAGAERIWWLGFAAFGWIYAGFPPRSYIYPTGYPTHYFLGLLRPMLGIPVQTMPRLPDPARAFFQIGHCLWALVAAVIGGYVASALFAAHSSARAETTRRVPVFGESSRHWWALPSAIVLSVLGLTLSIAVVCAPMEPGIWAGATYLLTWWLLSLSALGALFATGRRREFWLGATVLGTSFMLTVVSRPFVHPDGPRQFVPTVEFLEALRPTVDVLVARLSGDPDSIAVKNAQIRLTLRRLVPINFPDGTTLGEMLKFAQESTKGPDGKFMPIYVDPIGIQEAEQTMNSKIAAMTVKGVPLQTTLAHCLKQIGMGFGVEGGLIVITSSEAVPQWSIEPYDDPYQIVGHCLLALVAAAVGGAVAPWVCDLAAQRQARSSPD
jgi:hypothetical protein